MAGTESSKYDRAQRIATKKLIIGCCVCCLFMIIEFVAGILGNSLALLSDATHLLSDLCSFLISIFSIWVCTIQGNASMSFGYHRAEIIGALISVMIILLVTALIVYEAFLRMMNPPYVNGRIMLSTAIFGTIANLFMTHILNFHSHDMIGGGHGDSCGEHHRDHHHHHHENQTEVDGDSIACISDPTAILISSNEELQDHGHILTNNSDSHSAEDPSGKIVNMNLRAAYLHALGDLLQNIGVMIAAGFIWWNPEWRMADPFCAILFSIFVVCSTFSIIKESVNVLMEGTPAGIDIDRLTKELASLPDVLEVHDLHVWSLSVGKPALGCHLVIENHMAAQLVLDRATAVCQESYKILHTTIQIDYVPDNSCCDTMAHRMCKA